MSYETKDDEMIWYLKRAGEKWSGTDGLCVRIEIVPVSFLQTVCVVKVYVQAMTLRVSEYLPTRQLVD